MTNFPETGSASTDISATPETVWKLVADITRMGDWSPECQRTEWNQGFSAPAVGAEFTGHNKIGEFEWSVPACITACEPGAAFEFEAPVGAPIVTTWRFDFAPNASGGTTLTESFNAPMINLEGAPSNFDGRHAMLIAGMTETIAKIKTAAEA